ncbi:MAG TPA: hypothetical protein VFX16_12695 [Pseudonocardiaceae bacterium]|nr:hypothetical protein [Pseudonocardiaceae bacterium]
MPNEQFDDDRDEFRASDQVLLPVVGGLDDREVLRIVRSGETARIVAEYASACALAKRLERLIIAAGLDHPGTAAVPGLTDAGTAIVYVTGPVPAWLVRGGAGPPPGPGRPHAA